MDALCLDPTQTALVVVDVQARLLPAMPTADGERLVRCVSLLVETARRLGLATYVTEQYPLGLGATIDPIREALERFDTPPPVWSKTAFSAAAVPALTAALTGVRSVVVVGMEAHVCVFQTVRELVRRGHRVHVPFDAVASRDPRCRDAALGLLGAHGALVTTTETVVFDLLGDAQHPAFRALSREVRGLLG